MTNNLWFGNSIIYVDEVNDISELCESAMQEAGYDIERLNDGITEYLECVEMRHFLDNPTNYILAAMLFETSYWIGTKFEELGINIEVDYYVNGTDSHLYIDGEDYHDGDDTIRTIIENAENESEEEEE